MNRDEIYRELKSFVAEELLDGQHDGLDEDTPLLEYGIIDSTSVTVINHHIEETFGVRIPNEQLTPENLANLNTLTDAVLALEEN